MKPHCLFLMFFLCIRLVFGQTSVFYDTTIIKNYTCCSIQFCIDEANRYTIHWYNDTMSNVSVNDFFVLNDGVLDIAGTNNKYVVLLQNSGQKTKYSVLLPIRVNASETIYENVIGYDDINNNLLFISDMPDRDSLYVVIFNLDSEEKRTIVIPDICSAVNQLECLDDINYQKGKIDICYYGKDDNTLQNIEIRL